MSGVILRDGMERNTFTDQSISEITFNVLLTVHRNTSV
jgi:hypothetical protein